MLSSIPLKVKIMLINKFFYSLKILIQSPSSILILLYKYFQKYYILIISLFFKCNYHCNICNKRSVFFISDNWHKNIICPHCFSEIRHRLFFYSFKNNVHNLSLNGFKNKKIFHFAPENYLVNFFKKLSKNYFTADLHRSEYDYRIDISNMINIKNESLDCIIAIDVLEHVEKLENCLNEIKRTLKKDGIAIISVPQIDNLKKSVLFDTNIKSRDRKKIYGQADHSNLFGSDLEEIFKQFDFKVIIISSKMFKKEEVEKYTLKPKIYSNKKFATNDRKIFILYN